jgi:SM-20-related protein
MPDDVECLVKSDVPSPTDNLRASPKLSIFDDLLDEYNHKRIFTYLRRGGWRFGWKSNSKKDQNAFWHRHFAGYVSVNEKAYDCAQELQERAPLLYHLWLAVEKNLLRGHTLHRCYANGLPYGCEGTIHTDADTLLDYTSIYYPDPEWHPNWGGETVFFNKQQTDIVASLYPKPNRFLTFPATTPHVARGVSRICPKLRMTLMFKTLLTHDQGKLPQSIERLQTEKA